MKDVSLYAGNYVQEFNEAQTVKNCHNPGATPRWTPPPEGSLKINFDGGFQHSNKEGSIGVVIRDHKGMVTGAAALKVRNVADSFFIEALAACRALDLAYELGCRNVILEGDALAVIRKLSTPMPDFSPIGPLIDDAIASSKLFTQCDFSHVPRFCNTVAHQLAKHSTRCLHDLFWINVCPDMVQALVCNDFPVSYE